ncbi:MAG: glycosyltransferase [Actinobacteria bacterium]|nr:glycosyltransferase [Actinomycetota bacterium]
MRIGFISTYPPIECGIATYTKYLTDEIKKLNHVVHIISEYGALGERVHTVYNSQDPDLAYKIFNTAIKLGLEVVHIQHEFGLFGPNRGVNVIPLIYQLKLSKTPVVITMHTVYDSFTSENKLLTEALIRSGDKIIVHENYQLESIEKHIGHFDNITVIPHGVRKVEKIPDAKLRLGLEGKKVILLLGYFRPSKNFETIIELFPKIKEKVKESILVVAGDIRLNENIDYTEKLVRLINESPAKDSIKFFKSKFPQEVFDTFVSSADVAVLPYKVSSQSGIMAHFLAFGIPLVTSDLKVFTEIFKESRCGLISKTDEDYVNNIVKILTDDRLRNSLSEEALKRVNSKLRWDIVAKNTVKIYEDLKNSYFQTLPYQ